MEKAYIRGAGIHATGTIGLVSKTGTWRYVRPVREEKIPPCNNACPLGNDIQGFISLIREGHLLDAWRSIKQTSPFPGICGRICPHPCQKNCNRVRYDEAILIRDLERLVADYAFLKETVEKKSHTSTKNERIAIIGSGPAGLTCAYFLAKERYQVTVLEAMPKLGGMFRTRIPEHRLPREILDKEIADIEALGVSFKTVCVVDNLNELKDYEAIFVATGADKNRTPKTTGKAEHTTTVINKLPDLRVLPGNADTSEVGVKVDRTWIFGSAKILTGAGLVLDAIASGKKSAHIIDHHLRGQQAEEQQVKEIASFEDINTAYFPRQATIKIPVLLVDKSTSNHVKFDLGVSVAEGKKEAKRCFSCGICSECNNCYYFCPDSCVLVTNGNYEIDYVYCKGCGICSKECPTGVIQMEMERT